MRNGFREIAAFMDPVREINSLRELLSLHRESSKAPRDLSFDQIFERHRNCENETKILFYNTFLLPGVQIQTWCQYFNRRLITDLVKISEKPNRTARANEMAQIFGSSDYDYLFLCEAFDSDMNASIIEQLERSFDTVENATGASFDLDYVTIPKATFIAALALLPIAHPLLPLLGTIDLLSCPPFAIRSYGAELLNSGLLSVGLNKGFGSSMSYRFEERGDLLKDADYYSAKGVLKTVIGVNVGQIDIYSTHLYNGGDFIADVTEEEKQQVKLAQVTELLEFVNTSTSPSNVSIIMGDFNIDGIDLESEFYQEFISRMNAAGFDDICVQRCLDADRNVIIQPTSNTNNNICEVEGNFCNELTARISEGSTRLDYIFIERQNDSHSFILDYTRPRRVSFPNTEISPDMNFLSDHLGLEIILKPSVS